MDDRAGQQRRQRKTRDRALVLLICGLVLLMPPVAEVFHLDARIGGVPFTLAYLFVVWAGLIVVAARLAPGLRERPPEDDP